LALWCCDDVDAFCPARPIFIPPANIQRYANQLAAIDTAIHTDIHPDNPHVDPDPPPEKHDQPPTLSHLDSFSQSLF